MQAINVNQLIEDPLAGYSVILKEPGNFETFRKSVEMRLSLLTGDTTTKILSCDIENESLNPEVKKISQIYFVNELLYEYRCARGTTPDIEHRILMRWIKKVMKSHGEDAGLDLYNYVTRNRGDRTG
jgi:hypothetical protein